MKAEKNGKSEKLAALNSLYAAAISAGLCYDRKTFTQIAYTATGDKRLVANMTGHSEHSEAFNRYSEVTRDIKAKTLSKLE